MEIQQIRYVQAIAKYNNFSRAAASMFVTQPTLSQQIKKLEDEIGFPLFDRSTRTVTLTDEGKTFLHYSAPLLEAYDTLAAEVEILKKKQGCNIQVGLLPTFSHLNVFSLFHQFQSKHADTTVNFQIHSSRILLDMLLNDQLDLIIVNILPTQLEVLKAELDIDIFLHDYISCVLHERNPLSSKSEILLSDLAHENLILLDKKSSIRMHMELALKNNPNISPKKYDCPALHSMIGMVQANMGIGFLSSSVAKHYTQHPIISRPLMPPIKTSTAIVRKKDSPKVIILKELTTFITSMYP